VNTGVKRWSTMDQIRITVLSWILSISKGLVKSEMLALWQRNAGQDPNVPAVRRGNCSGKGTGRGKAHQDKAAK